MMNAKPYTAARIEKMRAIMERKGIEAIVLSQPENVFYFTNFNPILTSHPAYFLLAKNQEPCLLVHCIRNDHAHEDSTMENIQLYGAWGNNVALSENANGAMEQLIAADVKKIGVEFDFISISSCKALQKSFPSAELEDVSHDIAMMKIVKDAYEIDLCRKSAELVDLGVSTHIECLRKGMNEAEACTEGQYRMRRAWHEKFQEYEVAGFSSKEQAQIDSLCVWSMANERIAYGCDCPRDHVPAQGDLILPMSWARVGGYCVENERVVMVGKVSETRERAYQAMLEARGKVFSMIRPGELFENLYLSAMEIFRKYGFGDILPGRCGHGMGLSTHEFPSVTKGNQLKLEPGMIFTVEPGLMSRELGGVRHSDTVLVTDSGFESLTKYRNDIITI
ncbi:MAG: M24 family metallopeptidase [Faecalispora sporosphaeroides]|uniref:M24 family metallopeptidase n=1 Tax=Faecalispora sporosphaeroides TaxID=1549 RepID=UPI003991FEDE